MSRDLHKIWTYVKQTKHAQISEQLIIYLDVASFTLPSRPLDTYIRQIAIS